MTLERGTILHKRYRIVDILGQGGMGSVYRAVDENLGVDVAVKENLFTTDEYARQFRLEAVILASLRHPNLPRVTDHFLVGDQGQYLVMDYIEGEDLRQRMERLEQIPDEDAILIGAAISDALAYLHARKPPILHRDIKPGNVKITPDGHVYLVDFGLAKVVQGSQVTTTGARAMTPGYSPPEQYGTARTDPRSDIYSLGATLYAALTGVIPEDGLARIMDNAVLTPLRKRNGRVGRKLASAIEKAMEVQPEDRYQGADEFRKALLLSSSKTQRISGEIVVEPPPLHDDLEDEVAGTRRGNAQQRNGVSLLPVTSPLIEVPVPQERAIPRKRKKRSIGCLPVIIISLILMAGGSFGLFYYNPNFGSEFIAWFNRVASVALNMTPTPEQPTATATHTGVVLVSTPVPSHTPTLTPTPEPTATETPVPTVTPTPTATPLGGGFGQIAFASNRTGIPQVFVREAIGSSAPRQITNIPDGACQPDWSPDGQRLVFISPCPGKRDEYEVASLYIINADGTNLVQLPTAPVGGDFDPAWSPDGTRIAFTTTRDEYPRIFILNLSDNSVAPLTQVGLRASQPAWSKPGGTLIAFVAERYGNKEIWIIPDTGKPVPQAPFVRSGPLIHILPAWSFDGEIIFFTEIENRTPARLVTTRYEDRGSKVSRVTADPPIYDVNVSPDGFWLAFESWPDGTNHDIYIMTINGANRQRFTTDPGFDFDPVWRPITAP